MGGGGGDDDDRARAARRAAGAARASARARSGRAPKATREDPRGFRPARRQDPPDDVRRGPPSPASAPTRGRSRRRVRRPRAGSRSALSGRSVTRPGYNVPMREQRTPTNRCGSAPRWMTRACSRRRGLARPWILYLTFTLPSRHVTLHYDLAWVGFDVGLTASFAATAWAAFRGSQWLVPLAAVTARCSSATPGSTSSPRRAATEMWEAIAEAALAELPLAALCGFIVYDAETFLAATVNRFAGASWRRRQVARILEQPQRDARAARPGARARRARRA